MLDRLSIIGAEYLFIAIAGIAFIYLLKQPRVEQKRLMLFAASHATWFGGKPQEQKKRVL